MKVLFPARVIERHVGGNSTYARRLKAGLEARSIETGLLPMGGHPIKTLVAETAYGLGSHRGEVLHYSADTGALVQTRTPSVVTVHGVASRWIDVARNRRQESLWRFRVARALSSSQSVITVSESAADDVSEVFDVDRSRITVIPHGVDVGEFAVPTPLSGDLVQQLPSRYALYVGNIEPRKNLVELVHAFESKKLAERGLPLVIAGRPAWNFEASMSAITAAQNVHYVGFVSDSQRVALMQHADLFVFPSLYEGFGMPVLEAMAAGTPVACSRRGSLSEVSGPAWALDELDRDGLASSLAEMLDDRTWLESAPTNGRAWADRFDWDESIRRHIDVYKEVAA